MSPLRLNGSTSGYSEIEAPTNAGSETFTLHTAGGTLVTADGTQTLTNKTIQGGAITSGTSVASTSGTSIDFTGIPSWVKRITVMLDGVSTSGTSTLMARVGTSSGVVSSGYLGMWGRIQSTAAASSGEVTTGFELGGYNANTNTQNGSFILTNITGNKWTLQGNIYTQTYAALNSVGGIVSLSATLDRVRITTVGGTDTFDAGTINILYEG